MNPTHDMSEVIHAAPARAIDRLLTAKEVAETLQVKERWVRDATRSGVLPHLRLGRQVRYRADSMYEWVAERERVGRTFSTNRR